MPYTLGQSPTDGQSHGRLKKFSGGTTYMKKLVSAAMALCMIATMAVTAFAEDVKTTLSLGADSNGVNITDTLNPNTEYKFPLMIAIGEEEAVNFTEEHMEDNKFSVSITKGGSAIETPKVEKDDSDDNYYVVVKTKANYSAKNTDISFKLRYLVKASSKEIANLVVESVVGFNKMSDASIDALTKDEYLVVDPANPLITAKQFEKLAKLNDYKSVTMYYGDWRFTVNVSNMSDANMYSSTEVVREILQKYENQEFKFVSFPAKPDFGVKGTVAIDVSEEIDSFEGKFFLYKYEDGKLYKLTSKFDEDSSSVTFNASKLGSYVLTNKEIKDGTVIDSSASGSGSSNGNVSNPDTGANDVVGVAMALAVVSLIAVGAVSMKKGK